MNFLRYIQKSKIILSCNNQYKTLINDTNFVVKIYSTNAESSKMRFLNYLMPDQLNFSNVNPNRLVNEHNSENKYNGYENNNIQEMNMHNNLFWKQHFDKETIMSIFRNKNYIELRKFLKKIDGKCCRLLNQLSFFEMIQLLSFFTRIDETNITNTQFYNSAISTLKIALKRDQLSHQEIFMLLFFASLKKKAGAQDVKHIKKCLPSFNYLSSVEKSILADALFKCSVKLKKFEERLIEEILENEAEFFIREKHLLVPLCKVIRHAGPSKDFNIENFNRALENSPENFNLMICGHVLNLYGEALLRIDSVLLKLYNDAFASLKNEQNHRLKDIDNITRVAATLNYKLKDEDLQVIEKYIENKFSKFKTEHVILLNIIISLWMLGYKSNKLIQTCFKNQIFLSIVQNSEDWRSKAKLQLLINCVQIEAPDVDIPSELMEPYDFQIRVRKNLKTIYQEIQKIRDELNLVDLNITNPIKGIDIPSICMKYAKDKIVYIDLMDETTCLKNSNEPHGIMNLKLRLLTNSGCKSIVIKNDYSDNSNKLNERLHKIMMSSE